MKFYILGPIIITTILFIIFLIGILQYHSIIITKKIKSYFLLPLRIFSIIILLILLLEPYLLYHEQVSKNKINIYIDNSKSMKYNNIKSDSLLAIIDYFNQWDIDNIAKMEVFIFGDSVRLNSKMNLDFSDNTTNFFDLRAYIEKNLNVTNLIISDGNSTEGYNLLDLKFDYPINFIGLGFMNYQDISISNVHHSPSIGIGDSLNIRFLINSVLKTDTDSKLIISSNQSIIYLQDISLNKGKNKYNKEIKIPINNFNGEFDIEIKNSLSADNKFNNTYKGRVGIIDSKKNILIISGSLSPNTKKIKDILYLIPNSSIKHIYKSAMGWTEKIQEINFKDYNLIVYENFPISKEDNSFISLLDDKQSKVKYLFFEGPSCNLNTFNKIYDMLNVEIIENDKNHKFILDYYQLKNLPTVKRNFKINKDTFLKIYLQYSDSSIAIGENSKFLNIHIPELSILCRKDLSNKFEGYLSEIIYKYMDSGNSINLHIPNREIYSGQNLEFYLEFPDIYDYKNGELVINNHNLGSEYILKLNKVKINSNGVRYIEDIEEGKNTLYVNLFTDNNIYQSNYIELIVKKNNLESKKVFRNTEAMRDLAIKSNGNYYHIEEYNNIKSSILEFSNSKKKRVELDVHSFDKFWFIILITLIIEWFFRKKKGLL